MSIEYPKMTGAMDGYTFYTERPKKLSLVGYFISAFAIIAASVVFLIVSFIHLFAARQ